MPKTELSRPDYGPSRAEKDAALGHAPRLILRVCQIAGAPSFIADARASLKEEGVVDAIRDRNTAVLFDWLMAVLSYQGIADQVAEEFMDRHGHASWQLIASDLRLGPSCPKLKSYWQFHGCRYNKTRYTCAEPEHLPACPLPMQWLRNGRLNQTAYALHLFIRDVAGGDLVAWIDRRLEAADRRTGPGRLASMRAALLEPLREIHGVSDKVLMVTLSNLFLGSSPDRRLWHEVGASMVAVDTLVHNFLHRTGILRRFGAEHAYGLGCYREGGCADVIDAVSKRVDASVFNPGFPRVFPRFIQHAIWRYCAQRGLDVCNGNNIDDSKQCNRIKCEIYSICDREKLY